MAITIPGVSAITDSDAAVTLTLPTNTTDDILVIVQVMAAADTPVTPTGYTEYTAAAISNTGLGKGRVYYKRSGGSESNPTIGDVGTRNIAVGFSVRGIPNTFTESGIFAAFAGTTQEATTAFATAGLTTPVDGCMVVAVFIDDLDSAAARFSSWANADLASITELFDGGGITGQGDGIGIAYGIDTTKGSVTGTTATSATSQQNISYHFAFGDKLASKPRSFSGIFG